MSGATNYRIEQADSPDGSWTNVLATITVGGGMATCTVPVHASSMFFRVTADGIFSSAPDGMSSIPSGQAVGTNALMAGETYSESYPPNYSLTVDAFYIDSTEVTFALWKDVYDWAVANGYSFDSTGAGKAAGHPVHSVSWYDAVKWCNARSEKNGRPVCYTIGEDAYRSGQQIPSCDMDAQGFRLPTRQEWEVAARGGLVSKNFPGGDSLSHADANFYDFTGGDGYHLDYKTDGFPYTNPVESFSANAYGLYGMAGNVWEWCWDASDIGREIRGGSWDVYSGYVRCGFRGAVLPYSCDYDIGFRAVCRENN